MNDQMREALCVGDVLRTDWRPEDKQRMPLYLGSGRAGACFDATGLMNNPQPLGPRWETGRTVPTCVMHADHWHRGRFGWDAWIPLAHVGWESLPPAPDRYRQHLSLCDGLLTTEMDSAGLSLVITCSFHPYRRDWMGIRLRYRGQLPPIQINAITQTRAAHDEQLSGSCRHLGSGRAMMEIGTAHTRMDCAVLGTAAGALMPTAAGWRLVLPEGEHDITLLFGAAAEQRGESLDGELAAFASGEAFFNDARDAWHRRWGDSYIHIHGDDASQRLWTRGAYYLLASHAPDGESPSAPMGWVPIAWRFHFPQDVGYSHPALLRLGHLDIACGWVEFYRRFLDEMKSMTRDVYRAEGTMWAWEFPIGPNTRMLREGSPNHFQYELHNAAYPAKMAAEASAHRRDEAWTRQVAWPIIENSARFFASIAHKSARGTWDIHVVPSMGQDEHGGQDRPNYLCALYAARYALETAIAFSQRLGLCGQDAQHWSAILRDGLAFDAMTSPGQSVYATHEGPDAVGFIGKQKHPVQLQPLAFLPKAQLNAYEREAYRRRRDLCLDCSSYDYAGWTLPSYALAASHSMDGEGLAYELSQLLPAGHMDAECIQVFESSKSRGGAYYVTSSGMLAQAILDAVVSDFGGTLRIGAAIPASWKTVTYANLRTMDRTEPLSGVLHPAAAR